MQILYVLLTSLLVVFLESFLVALGNFRLLYLLTISLFNKINWRYLLVFSVATSLVLDVVYHYVLGTNLLLISISLILMLGISLIIPLEYSLPGYVVKFICILIYYISIALIPNLILVGQLGSLTGTMVIGMLIKSVISIVFCVLFDLVWSRLRGREEGTKLRLQ